MTALVNKHLSRRAVAPDATQTHRTKVKERTKKPFSPFIARMHTKKREKMTTKQREKTTKLHAPISSRSVAFDRAFLAPGASARAFSCAWSRPDAKIRSKSPVRAFRWTGATSARFRGSPGTFLLLCLSALKMKNSSEFCREISKWNLRSVLPPVLLHRASSSARQRRGYEEGEEEAEWLRVRRRLLRARARSDARATPMITNATTVEKCFSPRSRHLPRSF